jgi:hypothetical protein
VTTRADRRGGLADGELRSLAALAVIVGLAALLRAPLIAGAADLDSDAYGHFVVARRVIDHPTDLSAHWVWLPLWHFVHAAADLLGAGFSGVRWLSFFASLAAPVVLARALSREPDVDPRAPWVAAAALAFAPRSVSAGTSAEPEAVFALLTLGAVAALRAGRGALSGALASGAVLLRYEAWPLVAALALAERLGHGPRSHPRSMDARPPRLWWSWVAPSLVVLAWCALHRAWSGEWLWFVRENQAFVRRALPRLLPVLPSLGRRLLWYPVTIPWFEWGAALLGCAAAGFLWLARARRLPWVLAPAALVGFVTLSWARGQHLGLLRHAVSYLPYYALAIGVGASALARWVERRSGAALSRALVALGLAWCFARGAGEARELWLRAKRAMLEERAAAAVLAREARAGDAVFCDDAAVEALSGIARGQFLRWSGADVRPANLAIERARRGGSWLVTAPERARAARASTEPRYEGARVVVLRARPE